MDYGNLKVDTLTTSTGTIVIDDIPQLGQNVVSLVEASGVAPVQVSGSPITTSGTLIVSINQSGLTIAPSQLSNGALPSGVTVANTNIVDGTIGDAEIASGANIAPGKIAGTAVITSDARLSDERTPLDGSVTNAKVASGAAIDLAKLANGTLPSGIAIASGTSASTNLSYDNSTRGIGSSTGSGIVLPLVSSGNAGLAPTASGGTANFLRADGTWAEVVTTTNLSYDTSTRELDSSTGSGVTLPLVSSGNAGLAPTASGGTSNFLRADGSWAEVVTTTNLTYDASTRELDSSTGSGITLPLVSSGNPGLAPTASGGTSNFLRADGTWATAGSPPGGSDTQIQFNDSGAFGGDADLTYNKTTNLLTTKGDINLDDGGSFTTTVQCVTPTANRTISFPNATGTIGLVAGSSGQLTWNNAGAYAGASTLTYDGSILTTSGRFINSYNAGASAPAKVFTGTWFTGGTATTTKPHVLIEPSGATSTAWSTSGTGLGVNAASGFAGSLLDLQVNGTSFFKVTTFSTTSAVISAPGTTLALGTNAMDDRVGISGAGTSIVLSIGGVYLTAEGANQVVLAQRRGTNAQTYRIYNTYTSSTNYELGKLEWSSNVFRIGTEKGSGGGTARDVAIQTDGTTRLTVGATGGFTVADAQNIAVGTTTGTKIGTATTQRLGFFNATPVVQPTAVADLTTTATTGTLPTPDGSVTIADATTPTVTELLEYCVELEAKLEAALGRLRDLGLIAT